MELQDYIDHVEFLREHWGTEAASAVLFAIIRSDRTPMTFDEFLTHCFAQGGNWTGMLLTGIRNLAPAVYDAIPDAMGLQAWGCLLSTLWLMGVTFPVRKEEEE